MIGNAKPIQLLLIFLCGAVFSAGLMISGMINPQKVIGFLDIFGRWDASLGFVMAGAVGVNFIGHRLVLRRKAPFFGNGFALPTRRDIDRELVIGSGLFGIGWGLAGLCPGPAIAALGVSPAKAALFIAGMLAGMVAGKMLKNRSPGGTTAHQAARG